MSEHTPFFLTWLVTWMGIFLYLWRLEAKLRKVETELTKGGSSTDEA